MRNRSEKPQAKLPKNLRFSYTPRPGGTQALPKEAQAEPHGLEELFKTYVHYEWPITGMTHTTRARWHK